MHKLEILKKVIAKARKKGFEIDEEKIHWGQIMDGTNCYSIIFRDDFAKALWGSEMIRPRTKIQAEHYKMRLAEMVKSDNPIGYLERYLVQ
jgi:hypothetical protein